MPKKGPISQPRRAAPKVAIAKEKKGSNGMTLAIQSAAAGETEMEKPQPARAMKEVMTEVESE